MGRSSRPHGIDPTVMAQVGAYLRARDQEIERLRPTDLRVRLEVVNKADSGPAELRIYESIGGWFGITATDVAEALDEISPDRELTVRLNSPGGDVFDGTAIYNLLRTRPGTTNVLVDGLAASAASFIAQAGDQITMNRGTQMMIHDAIGFTIGNAAVHREQVALLDRVSDEIAGIYAARAGETIAAWRERMLAETWYNAAEAVEAGLADRTADDQDDDEGEDAAAAARAAARWGRGPTPALRPAAAAPAPTAPPAPAADDLSDEDWAAVGQALRAGLDETFDPMAGYDPAAIGTLICGVYDDAPAPPAVGPGPARPRTAIPYDEFADAIVRGIQEGARP